MNSFDCYTYHSPAATVYLWPKIKHFWENNANFIVESSAGSFSLNDKKRVSVVTLPFFYWTAAHRDRVPSVANVMPYGAGFHTGDTPDVTGRLIVQLPEDTGQITHWQRVARAVLAMQSRVKARAGHTSVLFKIAVPLSTRTRMDTLKSLFPCMGMGLDYLRNKGIEGRTFCVLMTSAMVTIDLTTLTLRLITLLPRLYYQHHLQKKQVYQEPDMAKTEGDGSFNWNEGVIKILGVSELTRCQGDGQLKDYEMHGDQIYVYLGS